MYKRQVYARRPEALAELEPVASALGLRLIRAALQAARAGCGIVSGLDLLLAQAVRQFQLFTHIVAPVDAMRTALQSAASARSTS